MPLLYEAQSLPRTNAPDWSACITVRATAQLVQWCADQDLRICYYRKRGSASYIVREVLLVREREREIQTDRDGSDVTIVALKLAMNLHFPCQKFAQLAMSLHFPLPKFALFVSPFTLPVSPFMERSPWWRWNSQWVHTFHCQKFFRPQALFPLFQMARAARRVIENPRQMIKSCPVLFCSSHRKTESN